MLCLRNDFYSHCRCFKKQQHKSNNNKKQLTMVAFRNSLILNLAVKVRSHDMVFTSIFFACKLVFEVYLQLHNCGQSVRFTLTGVTSPAVICLEFKVASGLTYILASQCFGNNFAFIGCGRVLLQGINLHYVKKHDLNEIKPTM